jgi:Tol biopolymer transport system component
MTAHVVMTVTTGTMIGRYAVGPLLGAGGMGEVYRAHDRQLDRDVAIKVLPPAFSADGDAVHRFEQEARATAAFNHPGVLAIYDFGVHEGRSYLVTELLEGQTLRERLNQQRLSVEVSIKYATEVAQALAVAHAKGIVHRDIKPENLFITTSDSVKILDFGLAKVTVTTKSGQSLADMTFAGTLPNVVLGTLGYMAPEQARAQPVDHRVDIFALGCVIFEMLAGRGPFVRETPADAITAILTAPPPPFEDEPARTIPPPLRLIAGRCVEKDPAARFQSASDLAFALASLSSGSESPPREPVAAPVVPPPRRSRWLVGAALGLLAVAGAAGTWAAARNMGTTRPALIEFLIPPPADMTFAAHPLPGLDPTAPQVGVSPDGRTIAFVATDASAARRLWIRSLDSSTPRSVDGSDGVSSWPFWSPDSRYLVYAAKGALWKLDVDGKGIERLCNLPDQGATLPFVTGAWNDGVIVFSIGPSGLYRMPATGGTVEPLTVLDKERRDNYHSWPQLLPGGRLLLFVRTDDAKTTGLYAGSLNAQGLTAVLATASRAVFAGGHLLWTMDDRLIAQPFDIATLELSGAPVTLVPAVFQGAGRTPAFWVSDGGTLVYGAGDSGSRRQFRWMSRAGASLGDVGGAANYASFDLSPDGTRVVAEVRRDGAQPRSTLSLIDTTRMVTSALTTGDLADTDPRFGPDGDVAFARNGGDQPGVQRVPVSGGQASVARPRGRAPVIWLEDWAGRNGGVIYRTALDPDGWQDLGDGSPRRLTRAREPVEQIQLSSDGRWIAYNNADSGRPEVYASSTAGGSERWQMSNAGGVQAIWRADGRELYYLGLDGGIYAVAIGTRGNVLEASRPELLFRSRLPVISAVVEQYRVTGDGSRFLFCVPLTSVQQQPLRVVLNWKERLPSSR